ncbi:MAG: pyridoxal-phosphate dependent enzyme [Pseudomonadota bacterium]
MTDLFAAPVIESVCPTVTPIRYLSRLTKALGGPEIYIKRDDMNGPANEDSGNKTRKLRFLAGEALAQGADSLVTEGGLQSNHCRQTAAVARKLGLACHIIYGGFRPHQLDGNSLLVAASGARLHFAGEASRMEKRDAVVAQLKSAGGAPYDFGAGGSTSTGALGYIFFVQELMAQEKALGITFDHIFHCSSSGGTEAGLVVGQQIFKWPGTIHSVVNDPIAHGQHHRDFAALLRDEIIARFNLTITPVNEVHDFAHEGYGETTFEDIEAIKTFMDHEGIYIDPVYGCKPARRMLDMVRGREIAADDKVLIIHTGGHPTMQHKRYRAIYAGLNSW